MLMVTQYILHKQSESMSSGKSKACKCKNVKGWELECANAKETRRIFGVVPIGGAIVRPR